MNIALIVLDTVRRDRFLEQAVHLQEMAEVEVECYSTSSWTVPSHGSMLTGKMPSTHGVHADHTDFSGLDDTFLGSLHHNKYGVSTNGWLSESFGFDTFFDEFTHFHGNEDLLPGGINIADFVEENEGEYIKFLTKAWGSGKLSASMVNAAWIKLNNILKGTRFPQLGDYGARQACKTAKKMVEEPFFLFMNVVDAHSPHENRLRYNSDVPNSWSSSEMSVWEANEKMPSRYLSNYSDLYNASIRYLDEEISNFIKDVQARTDDDTVFIVTSDHGEGLGQSDGVVGHKGLGKAVVEVPFLVINSPNRTERDRMSQISFPEVFARLTNGELVIPSENPIRLERIGDPKPPNEYWNRTIRRLVGGEEWDSPDERDSLFQCPIDEAGGGNQSEFSDSTQRQLEDLGYL